MPDTLGASSAKELLGFSREEWALPYADDPATASSQLAFFDAVTGPPGQYGGLVGVGTESLLDLARVSPTFAKRVAAGLASLDPDWRAKVEALPSASYVGLNSTVAEATWASLLSLIDAANS